MSSKELTAFLAWAEENEILWDKAAIEIKETPTKHGLGVFAKKNLEPGYEVIQVPKAIVLSVQTTGIANLLEDDEIEGDTALTIGCMYELSRGAQSPWAPYLTLLTKRPPQMATTLSKESREMMKMCEAYNDIEADIKDLQEDFELIVVPFIEKNTDVFTAEIKAKFFTLEAFRAMMEIVSSRGMDVDNFHVTALVPFADFVNHNSMPNADYLTHEEVCEICGALACEHMEDGSDDEDEDDEENEDGSDDDEVPDLAGDDSAPAAGKKSAAAKGKKAEEDMEEEGEEWEDEDAEEDDDEEINDTCDIILDDEVEKGEEITRHYGPYPNKILLSKYGFAVENNPHDTVTIQLDMVRQAAQRILKDEKLIEERTAWFLENEDAFIGAEGDDEEGGCCGGGDHDHDHDHEHGHGHGHDHHGHEHAEGDNCCAPKASKKKAAEVEAEDEDDEEMEGEEEEEEDDFPRDIMYMMHDGSIDDRLLMLLNVLFMEKDQFAKVQEDMEAAMEYFNDIFMRREQEERGDEDEEMEEEDEEEEGHEKVPKPELGPRDEKSKKTRKAVLEAILTLIRIRADAFGVTDKTTAEQDLVSLKKAKLSGPLYYGGLCVQGEKQILQNGLQGYDSFLAEL